MLGDVIEIKRSFDLSKLNPVTDQHIDRRLLDGLMGKFLTATSASLDKDDLPNLVVRTLGFTTQFMREQLTVEDEWIFKLVQIHFLRSLPTKDQHKLGDYIAHVKFYGLVSYEVVASD